MRELFREFVVFADRVKRERDRDITLAWHIAAMTRGTKGLPKLERLLSSATQAKTPQPQSVTEQRMALQTIFGNLSGKAN